MESLSEPNGGQVQGKKRHPIFDPPGHPLGYNFDLILVPFLANFDTSFSIDL